jgi:hypothetical protein
MQMPQSVAAADLNDDDLIDLVSANLQGDNLTIFFQTSPGQFPISPNRTLGSSATTNGAYSVAAADLNGDGRRDLVSANSDGNNLTIFFQVSPGQFPSSMTLGNASTTLSPVSVSAADLNGDGRLDLATANRDGNNLTVFFQTNPGQFSLSPDLTLGNPSTTPFPTSVAAADLDGDGLLDLVSSNGQGGNLAVFLQTSPGRFPSTPSFTLQHGLGFAGLVTTADPNSDGQIDLLSVGTGLSAFLAR